MNDLKLIDQLVFKKPHVASGYHAGLHNARMSHKWRHMACILCLVGSFIQHIVFEIHPYSYVCP